MERDLAAVTPVLSVACTEKAKTPPTKGVPLIVPRAAQIQPAGKSAGKTARSERPRIRGNSPGSAEGLGIRRPDGTAGQRRCRNRQSQSRRVDCDRQRSRYGRRRAVCHAQAGRHHLLVPAGRLQHDQRRRHPAQPRDEVFQPAAVAAHREALASGQQRHIQPILRNVDADVHALLPFHDPALPMRARAQATVRVQRTGGRGSCSPAASSDQGLDDLTAAVRGVMCT